MSRIPWTRYNGEDIEALVSMFVCRERPGAYRIRPSVGDGGVDVCVPISPGHVEIYQVKKFAENLTASEKRQIVKSHKRIQKYAEKRKWTIDKWHLTLPLDRTKENDQWLETLEATGGFPCVWVGLDAIEGWCAGYADIVDYYLRDGRERLQGEIAQWAGLAQMPLAGPLATTPAEFTNLEPAAVQDQLATLRTVLNKRDPHFRYDIVISDRPAVPPDSVGGYPALVASSARPVGDSFVTFHVFALCAESLNERPITTTAILTVRPGTDEHREFEELTKYGRIPTAPLEMTDLVVTMPGGLGGEFASGRVILEEPQGGETFERRLAVLSPTGERLAEVNLTMGPTRPNHDGTGRFVRGVDSVDFLTLELLSAINGEVSEMKVRVNRKDPTGHFPDQIEQALALVHNFTAPNKMRIAHVRGSASHTQNLPAVHRDCERAEWGDLLLRYVRALITIQRYTDTELRVPDLAIEDFEHVQKVLRAAELLGGRILAVPWDSVRFTLHPGASLPDQPQQVIFTQELDVTVGGGVVALGGVLVMIEAANIANVRTETGGKVTADIVPALGKDIPHLRWLGEASVPQSLSDGMQPDLSGAETA